MVHKPLVTNGRRRCELMSTENRPVMVLFMGGTEDHAVTSFQKYYPESVHIITSDKYAEKYETLLDQWLN